MSFLSARARRVLHFVRPYAGRLAIVLVLLLGTIALDLSFPWILQQAIDHALLAGNTRLLGWLTAALVALAGFRIITGAVTGYVQTWIASHVVFDMRDHLYAHLLRLPIGFFARTKVGDMMSRLHGDITEVQSVATGALVGFITSLLGLIGTTGFLIYYSWKLFLVSCVVSPLAALVLAAFRGRIQQVARDVRERNADLASLTVDALGAIRFVRASAAEEVEQSRYRRASTALIRSLLRFQVVSSLGGGLPGSLLVLGAALALLLGGRMVIDGTLTVGALTAFAIYQGRLLGPVQGLMGLYMRIQRARVSLDRIFEYLDLAPEVADRAGARDPGPVPGAVEFDAVSFAYEPGKPVLDAVSFTVSPGETLAILGPSGAGKTTLADLLWRFHRPEAGVIRIDGQDLADLKLAPLRGQMAIVTQDPHLWNATIAENIRYGRPEATPAEVAAAARAAGLEPLIADLPLGIDAPVGERGAQLSAGQRQRVALARAFLRRPRVLVLDEATNALDAAAEEEIRAGVRALMRDGTTLAIGHRLSWARSADQILLLDGGRVVEHGRPEDLARAKGPYAALLRRGESERETGRRPEGGGLDPQRLFSGPRFPGRGRGVEVALIDSGANAPHPHLERLARGVTVAVENGSIAIHDGHVDRNGHGTACAALIAYLAPEAEIHAIKIFERELRAPAAALVAAIRWTAKERIPVVNLSLGTVAGDHVGPLAAACADAAAAGTILIAAAPAAGRPSYPAHLPMVIAVGEDRALGDDELRWVGAPGLEFLTSGYARPQPGIPPERNLRGASFAAARLTSLVARVLEQEPGLDVEGVRARLRALAGGGDSPAPARDSPTR
jgi:ABC-type multidrug transport system fused ATPase/permease subunit